MDLPQDAAWLLNRLGQHGYEAYVVGGCVRDALLGATPKDWDICTSARPEEMQRVFADCRVVETGLKHGTLTVVRNGRPYEITTFRVDGAYSDHRHPDGVTFVRDVVRDLARRDFTVNAMAYHPQTGLVDAFGGRADLARGVIRCVGKPEERFDEDALRILRALRFASSYGFSIEPETDAAIRRLYRALDQVAPERVRVELQKLLCGRSAGEILRAYPEVITFLLPELKPCVGFDQRTPYHRWDVWEHTVRAVDKVRPVEALRLAMLLHDSGKPACFTLDEDGKGHFFGHAKVSKCLAETALTRLRVDNATRDRVLLLVEKHDLELSPERPLLTRRLSQLGEARLRDLMEVQRADALAKGTEDETEVNARAAAMQSALDALLLEKPCVTLRDLAVHGSDLLDIGYAKGPALGRCLNALLEGVVSGRVENDRETLLALARSKL